MIKYLGSKRELVPIIVSTVRSLAGVRTVLDPFSGTARVGHALKQAGYRVLAADHNAYAATLAGCYVQADREKVEKRARILIEEFNRLRGKAGYFTETYCCQSRFFQQKNGRRIDAIREQIEKRNLDPDLKAVILTSLMEAADRVDSTTGVQMAYLKKWAPRASNDLCLRLPDVLPAARHGAGKAYHLDAHETVRRFRADLLYIDPPYNQHSYLGNYHIWESLVLWDKPEVYGTACKRIDCRQRRSSFNSKPKCKASFENLVRQARAKYLLVSFNNEGYLAQSDIVPILAQRRDVAVLTIDYKRYVGAQIGIYNPAGRKVGRVSHLRNMEYLFLAGPGVRASELDPPLSNSTWKQLSVC